MRNYYQYILLGFVALLSLVACEKSDIESAVDSSLSAEAETHEVRLVLTDGATRAHFEQNEGNTRATVTDDGRFLWQSGDRFRLYAHKSDGSNAFPADSYIDFSYWINTTSAGRSFFRGTITEDMNDGSYTYYAVYPHSTPVEGTTATFTLPATQDGTYSRYDFMVARSTAANTAAASGNALQAIRDDDRNTPEPMNDIALSFRHKLHALRFEIPSQGVLSSGIRRVHILFSEAVAGDVLVNMANDEVAYTNMTNKITVDFGAGKEKHSGDVFWVMTLPQESFSRAVDIRFEDSNGNFTTRQLVTFPSSSTQKYTAGRITPIRMNVPSIKVGYTTLKATTADTQLGEAVTNLHLEIPVGYYFTDYSNKYSAPDINGVHTFELFDDMIDATFRKAAVTLTYESEHALIPTPINFGDGLQVGKTNNYSLTTPWLFEQNFNEITGSFNYELNKNTGAVTATSLGGYTSVLDGWYGARVGVSSGAVVVGVRHETVAEYRGRLDTSGIKNLKDGATVNIKVSFNANRSNKWAYLTFGVGLVSDGALQGGDGISVSSQRIDPTTKGDITYTNIDGTDYTYTFSNITNLNRLSWIVSRDYDWDNAGQMRTWYVYMDNIRVSIAQ